MSQRSEFSQFDGSELPAVIVRYLDAQDDRRHREAIADVFADNARVFDENTEYRGIEAIRDWLANAASEYTYTTTFIGQTKESENRWVVLARLEGNFPGGIADLRFDFTIEGDTIVDLEIAP